jgi:hypothetical protein
MLCMPNFLRLKMPRIQDAPPSLMSDQSLHSMWSGQAPVARLPESQQQTTRGWPSVLLVNVSTTAMAHDHTTQA